MSQYKYLGQIEDNGSHGLCVKAWFNTLLANDNFSGLSIASANSLH